MLKTSLIAVAALSLAGSACSQRALGGSHAPNPPVDHHDGPPADFVVTAAVLADPMALTLHLDREQHQLTISSAGDVQTVPVQPDGEDWTSRNTVSLSRGCVDRNPGYVSFQRLRLHTSATAATLTVSGEVGVTAGDTITNHALDTAFTGGIDQVGPRVLDCVSGARTLDFPEAPAIVFSEPLAPDAVVRLVPDEGATLGVAATESPALSFPGGTILAFGHRYQVDVQGYRDLGGLAGSAAQLPAYTTPKLAYAAQDGFEGPAAALLRDGAVIDDAAAPPPLSGRRSLYLPPRARYSARLAVAPGDTVVRLSARQVIASSWEQPAGVPDFYVDLAAPYGQLQHTPLRAGEEPFVADSSDSTRRLGTPLELTIPLPPGVTDEVMIRIVSPGGFDGPEHFVQLDDVRVE
jgi:hypothetical protein